MTSTDAHRQALAESRFYVHLVVFAVAAAALTAVGLGIPGAARWAGWLGAIWTVALTMHGMTTFWPFGEEWLARRVAVLRGGLDEATVYGLIDDLTKGRALPSGTAEVVRELQSRVEHLESGGASGVAPTPRRAPIPEAAAPRAAADAPDPFNLGAASAVGRPLAPEAIGAPGVEAVPDDPFLGMRESVDTPRLDTPVRRSRRKKKPDPKSS